jgi:Na+-driven multidrug efflux pump
LVSSASRTVWFGNDHRLIKCLNNSLPSSFKSDGLADAVEVRVGFRMGAGEMMHAKASAYKGMYLAIVISVYGTAVLFLMSGHLPGWLTPDPTLQHMIFEALPLIGFGQILMSVGMVCWNILGAQGRVRLATMVEFVTSWILVIPMAAILVFVYDYNLMGMVGPLVLGYTLGCVVIIYILFTSDWAQLSDKVVEQNGGNMNYDEVRFADCFAFSAPLPCRHFSSFR